MNSISDNLTFCDIAKGAQKMLIQKRQDVFSSDDNLAAEAGVSVDAVRTCLRGKSEEDFHQITGKEWERIISAARIFPEDVLMEATHLHAVAGNQTGRRESIPLGANPRLIAAGPNPSPESEVKIKQILHHMSGFYLEATKRYFTQNGSSNTSTAGS